MCEIVVCGKADMQFTFHLYLFTLKISFEMNSLCNNCKLTAGRYLVEDFWRTSVSLVWVQFHLDKQPFYRVSSPVPDPTADVVQLCIDNQTGNWTRLRQRQRSQRDCKRWRCKRPPDSGHRHPLCGVHRSHPNVIYDWDHAGRFLEIIISGRSVFNFQHTYPWVTSRNRLGRQVCIETLTKKYSILRNTAILKKRNPL